MKEKPFRETRHPYSQVKINQNYRVIDFTVSQAQKMFYMYPISLVKSKKISNDEELIQSDPTSCPQMEITKYIN